MLTRRRFLKSIIAAAATPPLLSGSALASAAAPTARPIWRDPAGIIDLARGLEYRVVSRHGAPMSDGLVQIKNASVAGAPRAFVHRSHSGHYGIVNSEEGYQNLRRFLCGQELSRLASSGLDLTPEHGNLLSELVDLALQLLDTQTGPKQVACRITLHLPCSLGGRWLLLLWAL